MRKCTLLKPALLQAAARYMSFYIERRMCTKGLKTGGQVAFREKMTITNTPKKTNLYKLISQTKIKNHGKNN